MPRFFFDFLYGDTLARDDEGLELDNIDAARVRSAGIGAQMLVEDQTEGHETLIVLIRNEAHDPVSRMTIYIKRDDLA